MHATKNKIKWTATYRLIKWSKQSNVDMCAFERCPHGPRNHSTMRNRSPRKVKPLICTILFCQTRNSIWEMLTSSRLFRPMQSLEIDMFYHELITMTSISQCVGLAHHTTSLQTKQDWSLKDALMHAVPQFRGRIDPPAISHSNNQGCVYFAPQVTPDH